MNEKTPEINAVLESLLRGEVTREQAVAKITPLVGDPNEAEFIVAIELGESFGDVIL